MALVLAVLILGGSAVLIRQTLIGRVSDGSAPPAISHAGDKRSLQSGWSVPVAARASRGGVRGTVRGPDGDIVPGATVIVAPAAPDPERAQASAVAGQTRSDREGVFSVDGLTPAVTPSSPQPRGGRPGEPGESRSRPTGSRLSR